jgi:PAS domain S-box-containing protein
LASHISSKIDELSHDVLFLSSTPPIEGIINSSITNKGSDPKGQSTLFQWKNRLSTIFQEMMFAKDDYIQIRFVGVADNGKELVRVEKKRSKIFRVIDEDLQKKEDEAYFKETLLLGREDIYVSEFSANKEYGKVVLPVEMVLRAAVPVFTTRKNPFGFIIININYNNIFSSLKEVTKNGAEYFVADQSGNVLLHSDSEFNIGHDLSTVKKVKDYLPEFANIHHKERKVTIKEIERDSSKIVILKNYHYNSLKPENYLSLFLVLDKDKILAIANEATKYDIWIILVLIFFSIVFSAYFSRFITEPIKKLTLLTEKIGKEGSIQSLGSDFLIHHSNDEIGILGQKLFEMSNEIESKNLALMHQNEALDNAALVLELDLDMKVTYANDKFIKTSEYSSRALYGLRLRDLCFSHPIEHFYKIQKSLEEDKIWHGEENFLTKDGAEYWVDSTIYPIIGKNKSTEKYIAIMFDITEKKSAQVDLELVTHEAKKAAESKASFLANMSHEIRTPLNGIIGFAGVLSDLKLSKEASEQVSLIQDCGEGLLVIINDILDYSKIEAGKLSIEKISINVEKTLESCLNIFNSLILSKKIDLHYEITERTPKVIEGDPLRLRQMLINLIGNAIKFTNQGSVKVFVDIHNKKNTGELELIFKIIDTGIGISEDALDSLFSPFVQADSSTTRKFGGTGLGLSICAKIVELMDGKIWVNSKEGVGSEFCFTILTKKLAVPVLIEEPQKEINISQRADGGLKILLAEDNIINQKLATVIFKKIGHTNITIANNGLEALENIKNEKFDVIFMDVQMPEMDGLEATRTIRKRLGATSGPIIIGLSANVFPEDREKGIVAGMNEYLGKPLNIKELSRVLNEVEKEKKSAA